MSEEQQQQMWADFLRKLREEMTCPMCDGRGDIRLANETWGERYVAGVSEEPQPCPWCEGEGSVKRAQRTHDDAKRAA